MRKHACKWIYYGGMDSCSHGFELLPDGKTRKHPKAKQHHKRGGAAIARREKRQ
jgi:hypothetical protein